MLLLEELDLLSDILKSGQHLDQLHVVGCRDRFCHIGRHDRLHERQVPPAWFPSAVFSLKMYSAISIPDIFPVNVTYPPVFSVLAVHAKDGLHPGLSRARCPHRLLLPALTQAQMPSGTPGSVGYRREITVRQLLLFYHVHLLESKLL